MPIVKRKSVKRRNMNNQIRAKMTVTHVTRGTGADGQVNSEQVSMTPVCSSDPTTENYDYSQATPSGSVQLTINNPAAFNFFQESCEYALTFVQVGSTAVAQ